MKSVKTFALLLVAMLAIGIAGCGTGGSSSGEHLQTVRSV